MIYPFLIALVWGCIPVIIKIYLSIFPQIFIVFLQSIILLVSSVIYIYFYKHKDFFEGFKNITYKNLILLIIIFFIASFICNLLYLHLIKKDSITPPLIIFSLSPMITLIASYLIFKELLNFKQLFGCILIFIGIFLLFYYKDDNSR